MSATPRRRQYAVEDLTWTWEGPLVLLLLGDSSSGKSTVLQLIENPNRASEGRVCVEGGSFSFAMAKFGNEPAIPLRDLLLANRDKLLEAVGLEGCHEKVPNELSPSERYRLELARQASAGKNIFLLDEWLDNEPTDIVCKVEKAIHNVARETSGIVCIVTHRPERFTCQNKVTLSFGRVAHVEFGAAMVQ